MLANCGDSTEPQNEEQQEEQKHGDAVSEQEKKEDDAKSDTPEIKVCPTGFTGENCDGCLPGFFGADCSIANQCVHGTPNLGINGDGQ